ncbi:F-box/kelch-repeat protein SKIP11-like [Cicer arietinum]|uniref:F-box/kelch-repeat protein SKIP11-like n=1 Tax=Cicer arietinum TaxID=3827 RepID=A0A1S2YQC5_CICAR|nr:F-box/kelch-repeat protein SKIP11-like [Cicer arietinum]
MSFIILELSNNMHQLEEKEKLDMPRKSTENPNDSQDKENHKDNNSHLQSQNQGNYQKKACVELDPSSLIHQLGRDITINCLLRLSRSDYGSIAALNHHFRSLIRTGELYQLRRKMDIIEHWVYFSCDPLQWEAFDPNRGRWMHLPRMNSNELFMLSDKESLAVGTNLLVFGTEIMTPTIYKYSLLTNEWTKGMKMNISRCLFGSASIGEIAILAGGCDLQGNIFKHAELYNSDTNQWEILPDMNTARKMCSGVFMDEKFYVLGGIGADKTTKLTSGEEFDLKTRKWHEIPNMCPPQNETATYSEAPPLIAVVNNVLYVADHAQQEIKRYVKDNNSWVTIGKLPERAFSMNGWGIAFRACGNQLFVIGGSSFDGRRVLEVNAWAPNNEDAPQWNLLARRQLRSFVYNCTVMGC